ncbi:uncharacterized protein LOC114332244 [Diabrotica virgifera virgifera]|uniref:Uncharacterized protein LOC114332244 n=1 Tax=Diabrotica virgifera virgifera TaxID=50390 RepID=A0A6P7FNC1_DIAVI|nr:uncharacterized protein LOC114332244 [Diabrotica virgifera virgifera]
MNLKSYVILFSILVFCVNKSTAFLKCYACSTTEDDADTHCLDNPGSKDTDILECDKKYCYVVRQDYKDPRGKLQSITRTCLDKPTYSNKIIEDATHRIYFRACKSDLCNGGNGHTDESSGEEGAFGDKGTIYVPGTGSNNAGKVKVFLSVNVVLFVVLCFVR